MTIKFRPHPQQTGEIQDVSSGYQSVRSFGGGGDWLEVSFSGRHHPFHSYHEKYEGGGADGSVGNIHLDNWPTQWTFENWNPIMTNDGNSVPNVGWLSTELFARTRPDSKLFDISRAIGELKDLPGMIKRVGDKFLHEGLPYAAGHLNLTYKFGWKPFFDDCAKMTLLQVLIAKRFAELKKLQSDGMVRRSATLFHNINDNAYQAYMEDWDMSVTNSVQDRVWGYTVWKPTGNFPSTDQQLMDYARKTALNLDITNGQTAWQLIPWTWLSDWFLNVGTYLEACRNSDEFTCSIANIMHENVKIGLAHSTGFRPGTSYPGLSLRPYYAERITRTRFPADPPTITANIPILNSGHIGILGSIVSTKIRL